MFSKVTLSEPTDASNSLADYDHTKLSAINTCPVYGIIRYAHHKVISHSERQLPLEAGQAAHEAFAAVRLYQLGHVQNRADLMELHGRRIFGDKWPSIIKVDPGRTQLSNLMNTAINAFESTGYFDDEYDRRRTKDNIIEALMEYCRQWDFEYDIWIRHPESLESDVGIEIPYRYTVDIVVDDKKLSFNYTGKMDGICLTKDKKELMVDENKTGARIDDAWLAQWRMSHQITGYAIAAARFADYSGPIIPNARIIGMQIPLPRAAQQGIRYERVPRRESFILDWSTWLYHTVSIANQYNDDPVNAPRYTTSCNRYFRACQFLPLCDSEPHERREILSNMPVEEWSPLK